MSDDKPVKTNYPGNTNREKLQPEDARPDKKVVKSISGKVTLRKKSLGRKIAETFVGDDMHTVSKYVIFEVLIPAAKTMLFDSVTQGLERSLFGGESNRRIRSGGNRDHVSYNKISYSAKDSQRTISQKAKATHDFDEIVFANRDEAEEAIVLLIELISQYDVATVSDLYDIVNITGSFTDDKWGWTDLRSATSIRVRNGYILSLPKPRPID